MSEVKKEPENNNTGCILGGIGIGVAMIIIGSITSETINIISWFVGICIGIWGLYKLFTSK